MTGLELDSKRFLRERISTDLEAYFGDTDPDYVESVTDNWFDDARNYDGRWAAIQRQLKAGNSFRDLRVLDMAAGCGTFVLYGLKRGYNVWGIEPEEWKLEFVRQKIAELGYPGRFMERFVASIGEELPFVDGTFDIVTTYQTLEHVQDVKECLEEMLRVLRAGGSLYIRAPDYNSFYEGHYRLPWLPQMNRELAKIYLRLLGRPTAGLDTLQYVTTHKVIRYLKSTHVPIVIEDLNKSAFLKRKLKIRKRIPLLSIIDALAELLNIIYEFKIQVAKVGRSENTIDLWVTKL